MQETQYPNKGRESRAEGLEEELSSEDAEETLAEALCETQGPEGCGGKKGGKLSEVSLRDPWPPDHPLRSNCDRFMEIFKTTYHEVLAEMGLTPESGDFSFVIMSNKDFKEMAGRMVDKLNANPEARELMAVLNVDFSDRHHKRVEAGPEAFAEGYRLIFEAWRKKHQDAAQADENDSGIKDSYRPEKQPSRNMGLLDFWQGEAPKRRAEDAQALKDYANEARAAVQTRPHEAGDNQALRDYTKFMDKILGRNSSAHVARNKEEKIKELTQEIKKLQGKLSEIAFNPQIPDQVKSIQVKTINTQIKALEAQISKLASEGGEEDGSDGGLS
jgi:hypothetical protein